MKIIKVVFLLLLSSPCFAFIFDPNQCSDDPTSQYYCAPQILSAKEARDIIMNTLQDRHEVAIDWWIKFINGRIQDESSKPNASVSIDITKASHDVQQYLAMSYDAEGFEVETIPGWTGEDERHHGGHPDGKTYLGLSW